MVWLCLEALMTLEHTRMLYSAKCQVCISQLTGGNFKYWEANRTMSLTKGEWETGVTV